MEDRVKWSGIRNKRIGVTTIPKTGKSELTAGVDEESRQQNGVLLCNPGSAALQKGLHIHPHSEGLSPGCSHLGCRNYQNPSKGRGCLGPAQPCGSQRPQRLCDLRMPPVEAGGHCIWAGCPSYRGPFIYGAQVQLYESVSTNFQVWCTFAGFPHPDPGTARTRREVGQWPGPHGISAPSPASGVLSWPVLCVWAPVLLGLAWGHPDIFSRNSWWCIFLLLNYNFAIWSLRKGISGNCVSAEILWDFLLNAGWRYGRRAWTLEFLILRLKSSKSSGKLLHLYES